MKTYYVYIVLCSDDSYYIGVTSNLEQRIIQHNSGYDDKSYTYTRRPVVLQHQEEFSNVDQAIEREKQLKNWSRKKKSALIEQNDEKLRLYSKKKFIWK